MKVYKVRPWTLFPMVCPLKEVPLVGESKEKVWWGKGKWKEINLIPSPIRTSHHFPARNMPNHKSKPLLHTKWFSKRQSKTRFCDALSIAVCVFMWCAFSITTMAPAGVYWWPPPHHYFSAPLAVLWAEMVGLTSPLKPQQVTSLDSECSFLHPQSFYIFLCVGFDRVTVKAVVA